MHERQVSSNTFKKTNVYCLSQIGDHGGWILEIPFYLITKTSYCGTIDNAMICSPGKLHNIGCTNLSTCEISYQLLT